jgi:hypothetical protein
VSLRLLRPLAVCLAVAGQVAGAVGVPVAGGSGRSAEAPDAACGCCPADRAAHRCCCHQAKPACCRGKAAASPPATWAHPALRAKCVGPDDAAPGSVLAAAVPPNAPVGWSARADEAGPVAPVTSAFSSHRVPPDDPPPRGR